MNLGTVGKKSTKDYAVCRADLLNGLSLKEISDNRNIPYAALAKYAKRHQWGIDKSRIDSVVSTSIQSRLSERATRWIERIDHLVHQGLDSIESAGVGTMKLRDLQVALDCAERANRIARVNYGLDADNGQNTRVQVNLQMMASPQSGAEQHYIDVASVQDSETPADRPDDHQ